MGQYDGRVKLATLDELKTLRPVPLDGSLTATDKSDPLLHDAFDQKMVGIRSIVSDESDGTKLLCGAHHFVGFARVRLKTDSSFHLMDKTFGVAESGTVNGAVQPSRNDHVNFCRNISIFVKVNNLGASSTVSKLKTFRHVVDSNDAGGRKDVPKPLDYVQANGAKTPDTNNFSLLNICLPNGVIRRGNNIRQKERFLVRQTGRDFEKIGVTLQHAAVFGLRSRESKKLKNKC